MLIKFILLKISLFFPIFIFGQKTVTLENPSFEGIPGIGFLPANWEAVGFDGYTPPDTHPGDFFQVNQPPYHGDTYVGLVTRFDNSWEGVGQYISPALLPNTCYHFSIYLSRSPTYISGNRLNSDWINHHNAVQLEIWGGEPDSPKNELLAKSESVINTNWLEYHFKISPSFKHKYISLEAKYIDGSKEYYAGNLLIDFASDFEPIDCSEKIPKLDLSNIEMAPVPSDSLINLKFEAMMQKRLSPKSNFSPTPKKSFVELWEEVKFIAFSDELTKEGKAALEELAKKIKQRNRNLIIVLVKGEDDMKDNRIDNLTEALNDVGIDDSYFTIKPVRPSDLHRKWFVKNYYIWVRYSQY